jgi:hypothetical protein
MSPPRPSPAALWKDLYTLDDSVQLLSDRLFLRLLTYEPFRDFLQRPLEPGSSVGNITTSQFAETAITEYSDLVTKHFQQHPVLYIDLKVNLFVFRLERGLT